MCVDAEGQVLAVSVIAVDLEHHLNISEMLCDGFVQTNFQVLTFQEWR